MANPIAVPGTNVPSGAAVSPGGAQGVTGIPAWTTCTSSFTVPTVGSTVLVPVVDTSWVTIGEMLYVDQAGGGVGLSGILQVTAKTSNSLTLLNPTPPPAIPPADATQAGLLKQLSGNTADFVDGTNACQNLATAVQPVIWSVRLRSINILGNPNGEITQRNIGSVVANPANGSMIEDRWSAINTALNASFQSVSAGTAAGTGIVVPGTNQAISTRFLRISVGTQKVSLAAGDAVGWQQVIEGPVWRNLMNDVHSLSILARSTVANLKFGISLRDYTTSRTLTKLCTLGAANTFALIQLPTLPIWPSAGNFTSAPGSGSYMLVICAAAGSTYLSSANDTWQTGGNFLGALGQDNLLANAVGSSLDIAYISHEPGAQASNPPIDCPFTQNLDACLRYYQKSYEYPTKAGTSTPNGMRAAMVGSNQSWALGPISFYKPLAKTPTITIYAQDGTINAALPLGGSNISVNATPGGSTTGFYGLGFPTTATANTGMQFHYIADTGW